MQYAILKLDQTFALSNFKLAHIFMEQIYQQSLASLTK